VRVASTRQVPAVPAARTRVGEMAGGVNGKEWRPPRFDGIVRMPSITNQKQEDAHGQVYRTGRSRRELHLCGDRSKWTEVAPGRGGDDLS